MLALKFCEFGSPCAYSKLCSASVYRLSPVSGRVQLVDINVEPDNMRFMRALNVHCAEPEGLSFYIRVEILQL